MLMVLTGKSATLLLALLVAISWHMEGTRSTTTLVFLSR
jgi:hypothetical protein